MDRATQGILDNNKSPEARVGQTDTRTSHYYFALYWAKALANQNEDTALIDHFAPIATALEENEATILAELAASEGAAADLGGYFHTDPAKNKILADLMKSTGPAQDQIVARTAGAMPTPLSLTRNSTYDKSGQPPAR